MNIKVKKNELSNALKVTAGIVSNKVTMPVLGNVFLAAEKGKLTVESTNLDMALSCSIECEIKQEGRITLPAKRLDKIVSNINGDDVTISVSESGKATIKAGTSKYTVMGITAEDFPPIPEINGADSFSLQQEQLAAMLKKVAFAQSQDETRFILNGTLFTMDEGALKLVATDGRRLAITEETIEFPFSEAKQVIVPRNAIMELRKLLNKKGDVTVSFSDRQISFCIDPDEKKGFSGKVSFYSKVVEGNYPNYSQVIPKETNHSIELDKNKVEAGVKRVALVNTDKSNTVKFSFEEGELTLSCASPDFGDAEEKIQVELKGEPIKTAYNAKFMQEMLAAIEEDTVSFSAKDGTSAGLFTVGNHFKSVLMPLRLE